MILRKTRYRNHVQDRLECVGNSSFEYPLSSGFTSYKFPVGMDVYGGRPAENPIPVSTKAPLQDCKGSPIYVPRNKRKQEMSQGN